MTALRTEGGKWPDLRLTFTDCEPKVSEPLDVLGTPYRYDRTEGDTQVWVPRNDKAPATKDEG